jgi:Tfp pilus assembly protein PilF
MFQKLVDSGIQALQAVGKVDSGASFEEQQSYRQGLATAHYVAGLGCLGLNDKERARKEMTQALQACPDHLAARNTMASLGN